MKKTTIVTVLLSLGVMLILSACAPTRPGPQVWIDFPGDGAVIPAGIPVNVISHASARDGVAEVMLSVNGTPYLREVPENAGEDFVRVQQLWEPLEEGDYVLEVRAYTTTGEMSAATSINVRVGSPLVVVDERVPLDIASEVPSLTPTLVSTNTPTPTVGIPTVTVTATEIVDNVAPPVPTPMVPADGLVLDCRSTQNLAWLPVDDPSGIAGYYVKLETEVTAGNWISAAGYGPVTDKQVEIDVDCGVFYRWSVRAQDGAGNFSDFSAQSYFSVSLD